MSKPPLTLVSRYRPAPGSPPRSPPRRALSTAPAQKESRILAALEANNQPVMHRFFRAATAPAAQPHASASRIKATTSLPVPGKKSSLVRISPPKVAEKAAAAAAVIVEETEAVVETPVDLPVYTYKTLSPAPKMRFTRDEAEADKWVAELDENGPICFDAEPVSVVQVADKNNIIRFPRVLQRILEDPSVPKMGANILNDAKKLFTNYGVMLRGLVELGALARQADPACAESKIWGNGKKIVALAKLVERYLQKKLLKEADVRLSNWENPALEKQQAMLECLSRRFPMRSNDVYCGLEALATTNGALLDAEKYTGEVYHPVLGRDYPRLTPQQIAALPPVPMIILTPAMEAAGMLGQFLRAYRHWRLGSRDIDTMCVELAVKPGTVLQRSTVISYVVGAVKAWPSLPCDMVALRLLIQMDLRSWERHYDFIVGVTYVAPVKLA
ncbi:hypothetical protein C8R46DRAFT_1152442 [Mycena filopes]|nr:hypothetical protein C8R46DRAFT_1152442 [Mycena filopes]